MLKNRTSEGRNTFDKIQNLLAKNGAKKVMFDYSGDGTLEAISFALDIDGKLAGFRLPALVENVFQVMYGEAAQHYRNERYLEKWREQAYKTAWANIRDWIDAQLALVATRQVKLEQVFLPYLVIDEKNTTLYDKFISDPKFLLEN